MRSLNPFYTDALLYFTGGYVTDSGEFGNVGDRCMNAKKKHIAIRNGNTMNEWRFNIK